MRLKSLTAVLVVTWLTLALSCQQSADRSQQRQPAPSTTVLPIVVENYELGSFAMKASKSVRVASMLTLERLGSDGQWMSSTPSGFRLVTKCDPTEASANCRELRANETVITAAWNGSDCAPCDERCASETFNPGVYRIVIRSCEDPTARVMGPPFALPPERRMLQRWRAVADAASATVMRLDQRFVPDQPNLVQFVPRAGSERHLPGNLLAELVALVRSDKFVDGMAARCLKGPMLAFDLKTQALVSRETRLIVELGCAALTVPDPSTDLPPRVLSHKLFDAFLDLATRALPGDPELVRFLKQHKREG